MGSMATGATPRGAPRSCGPPGVERADPTPQPLRGGRQRGEGAGYGGVLYGVQALGPLAETLRGERRMLGEHQYHRRAGNEELLAGGARQVFALRLLVTTKIS